MPADVLTENCGSRLSREIQNFAVMADLDPESSRSLSEAGSGSGSSPSIILPQQMDSSTTESGTATKKSSNMTERVRVPSSEHVAEIVGRQGCKIKALRAKTNTYIKTPARGDEPVFVVTGRQEDVAEVKREILSAAEHFSQIRASRRNAAVGESPRCPAVGTAEQVREKVPVPFWVVGLVVGPKGTTIRRIQQDTQTYIITPGKEKEPVFEILGTTENVNRARQEIESYIALRMRPRHNHMGLGGSWTKLDGHVDALCPLQQQASLRSSFQVKSNGCLSDAKLSESLDGRYAPPNWRQLPGCTGRPLSVDVAAFIRRVPTEEESFPSMERNRFFHEKNMDVPQKSFLGLEALISNCLSDLNLSENVLQSFIHHETSPDLRPSPATRCGSKMPFALRPLQADVVEFRDELTIPFDGLESDPLP